MSTEPIARTSFGVLRGVVEAGVCMFRGVPYAAAPVGAQRFAMPQSPRSWSGERDATRDGPIPPQPPSRLRAAMGDFDLPQSEDCLTLTIATPAADGARRPVLVWFHGGAFWTGAGSLSWYSGAPMARHGDVVVVGVNYRLGALGFMHLPGIAPPNLGLYDQFAALDWVGEQIAAFGGDPDNVTVFGQSAGGLSVLAMLASPRARSRFRRAIVHSAPFGRSLRSRADAAAIGEAMQRELGISGAADWREVPAERINTAQVAVARSMAVFANTTPPFMPVADHELLGDDVVGAALAGAAERDLIIGYTHDEMAAFFAPLPEMASASEHALRGVFAGHFGAAAGDAIAEYRQRARLPGAGGLLGAMLGDASFAGGVYAFAERLAALDRPARVFRFDFAAPGNAFGACHCIELPFVFDTLADWDAPMLAGADREGAARLAAAVRDAWIAFARTGEPTHPGLPSWPRHGAAGETLLLDAPCRVTGDPAGRRRWRYWP
ncbi:MAG: carboxylesterase/lipase family protein [Burkholderiales bacterium]|nr:carboxylesterase/lipase family protein [Burkholderiales bacterium]